MSLQVRTISRETIKPSRTPTHLRSVELSELDHRFLPVYIPLLFFYSNTVATKHHADEMISKMKTSLAQTLTLFYPLAGRIALSDSNTLRIDCNDAGVEFIEAETEEDLDSFLTHPKIDRFPELLPVEAVHYLWPNRDPLLAVQLTVFGSYKGGFVLGICIAHQIADSASAAFFLRSWAGAARGLEPTAPRFDSSRAFPPVPLPEDRWPDGTQLLQCSDRSAVTKRFLIAAGAIERLRKGSGYVRTRLPTRVEAVSALVWRCVARTRGRTLDTKYSVNLRPRMPGTLSERSFGNLYALAYASSRDGVEQGGAETAIRNAIAGVDEENARRSVRPGDAFAFSSWCRFPWYETDFGWGEPAWFSSPGFRGYKDICLLIDAKDGDGLEILLSLEAPEMERIQSDAEFLDFFSHGT